MSVCVCVLVQLAERMKRIMQLASEKGKPSSGLSDRKCNEIDW